MLNVPLPANWRHVAHGKVRELFEESDNASTLLFVASDRISAFDCIMENDIPDKGPILTAISEFWFDQLKDICPNHFITTDLSSLNLGDSEKRLLEGRSMIVKKLQVCKVEAIVRGYITGSAWQEYQKSQTVHGIPMPEGLQESQALPEPIFTPSTKAELGEHDENIHPDKLVSIIGAHSAALIASTSLKLYKKAYEIALAKGIIIADTKFEFGQDEKGELYLVDEVLTPDSSRFWSSDKYECGKPQESFDKQFLRDYLIKNGLKGKEVTIPEDIVVKTREKYVEAFQMLTGKTWYAPSGNR